MARVLDADSFARFINKRERASMDERLDAELQAWLLRHKSFRELYALHNGTTVS